MRIKDVVTLINDKTTYVSKPYIALENIVSWDAKFIESEAETEGTNNVFKKGDVLFGKLRPYLAKGFCPSYDGICSTEFFVMRPKKDAVSKYLLLFFLSDSIIDYIKNQVTGVKMPRTKWSDFGNIAINMPSLKEQQRIVDYLDNKLSNIDSRIAVLEKQTDAYARLKKSIIHQAVTRGLNPNVPLKDSGTKWIEKIPKCWEVKRVKDLCSFVSRGSNPDYVDESDFPVMNQAVFSSGCINHEVVRYSSCMKPESKIEKGDLLIASTGGGILGKLYFFNNEDKIFYADTHVTIVRSSKKRFYVKFLYYLLSIGYNMINSCMAKGSTNQTELQRDKLIAFEIALPPIEEQTRIIEYLDEECAKIDAAIENISKQIDASKRLKRALINEVITGQRAV